MSKTPYEIRFDLLTLAKEILFEPVHNKRGDIRDEFFAKRETVPGAEWSPKIPFPEMPDFPTSADIIAEAEKLNRFVSNG